MVHVYVKFSRRHAQASSLPFDGRSLAQPCGPLREISRSQTPVFWLREIPDGVLKSAYFVAKKTFFGGYFRGPDFHVRVFGSKNDEKPMDFQLFCEIFGGRFHKGFELSKKLAESSDFFSARFFCSNISRARRFT